MSDDNVAYSESSLGSARVIYPLVSFLLLSLSPFLPPFYLSSRWFHPNLTRHQAEAELLLAEEGVYLMRPRISQSDGTVEGYSMDVR